MWGSWLKEKISIEGDGQAGEAAEPKHKGGNAPGLHKQREPSTEKQGLLTSFRGLSNTDPTTGH